MTSPTSRKLCRQGCLYEKRTQRVSWRVLLVSFSMGLCAILSMPNAEARKIKTKHSITKQSQTSTKEAAVAAQDSILSIFSDSITFVEKVLPAIRFYGFDKTITSNLESFFISNGLNREISKMEIAITYFDMKGRQLHKRTVTLDCDLPAGQTKRYDVRSWDTQRSFYFHQSVKPKRQATPFNVKIDLLSITY